MKLSAFFGQISQNYTGNTNVEGSPALEQGLKNGMEAVMGKQPGQTIAGEVLTRDGSDILIAIGKNQLLQAKLEGGMTAQIGQLLTFQIKNNSSSRIVLSPLFENMGNDPNVSKALQAAGLPENSVTAAMVKAMMQEGLPINRQSLYQMNRLVNANPEANLQTLAQMQRLSLPVTPENIAQFEAYKNYQHQLGQSLSDIMDAFTQSFKEIAGSDNLQEGLSFYREVLGALLDGAKESVSGESPEALAGSGKGAGDMAGTLPLSEKELSELARQLRKAGFSEDLTNAVINNRIGGKELLNELQRLLSQGDWPDRKSLMELLDGKEFKQILKNEMGRQWLLSPEEVAEEKNVDKLYERLNNQMNRLNQALSQSARADTPLARTVSNVSNNINFMNQLNQMFTYVQIPLKMQGQNANGELFVYTNKKSLAKKDGSVSALLHLDMEHLGSVDVHVSMTNQNVSTKFYLQDDSALDLIADNIDILNKRLSDRGYSMNAEFINKEEGTSVMDEILKQGKNISALAGYSFDARA